MSEHNKALVRRLLEDDRSRGDEAVAEAIIHPAFVDHTNPPGMQHGIDGHKAIGALFRAAFPDLEWRIDDLIAEGDKVVARITAHGTHEGELFGIPATGKTMRMSAIGMWRIADGKIVEHWYEADNLGMMQQLGVVPIPEHATD